MQKDSKFPVFSMLKAGFWKEIKRGNLLKPENNFASVKSSQPPG